MDVLWILIMALKKIWHVLYFNFMKSRKHKKILNVRLKSVKSTLFLRNNTSDMDTFYQIFDDKEYDMKFNFEPEIIVDCGANIGLASVFFKNKFPNAQIIAIEPESSNYELLLKNTGQYSGIQCLKMGIWNKTTNLEIKDIGKGNWGFITEETDKETESTVKAISIDKIMEQYSLKKIDILKIDIEGSEKELFEKNTDLWVPYVKFIVIEFHDSLKEGCSKSFFNALRDYKFKINTTGESIIIEICK